MQRSRHTARPPQAMLLRVHGSWRGRGAAVGLALAVISSSLVTFASPMAAQAIGCTGNAIACENQLPGSPATVWDVSGAGDETIQGFATSISVASGGRLDLKVKTDAGAYTLDVYRLGWYAGNGARKVAALSPPTTLPQVQPSCVSDQTTGLYDCGTWAVSSSWQVPATAVSGVYVVKLRRSDTGGSSHIPFIVRNDASRSDVVFQTSDPTWQAYNSYGGANFYRGPGGRAYKLSYNRPFDTRGTGEGRDYLFGNEYPLIRFMERNGYDVSYISGLDTDRAGSLLTNHKTFLSVGHDEYWSGQQRTNVEAARDAGVNLAFFSGNEVYWKTRWEPSIDGSATPGRTLVCYKETWDDAKIDPSPEWTGTWRDPRFSPPSDGGRPENALTGTAYVSNFTDLALRVSAEEGKRRFWRGTAAATQAAGQTLTLAPHTVGYESDEDLDNGHRPAGMIRLSTTTGPTPQYLRDFGTLVTPGTTTHHLTLYRAPSGALVFGAGTVQWTWGLDAIHDGTSAPADPVMQQATVNLLADMGSLPTTLMPGMTRAEASSDMTPPSASVASPAPGTSFANGDVVTATGTATDAGGGVVAGVEVSTDDGATWHVAKGTSTWSYTYTQRGAGATSVRVRATDDSLNTGLQSSVTTTASCPCTLFATGTPTLPDAGDGSNVELGMRFSSSAPGWVTGVRFFKSAANSGLHTGSLWSATGARLATGAFSQESASGWQTLLFDAPVPVTAQTTYVASYHAPAGRYAADKLTFSAAPVLAAPLTAPRTTSAAPNGVFALGAGFPDRGFNGTNYWVDVVFEDKDTRPPTVVTTSPLNGSSSVSTSVAPTAVLSEPVRAETLRYVLTDDAGVVVPGTQSYVPSTNVVSFTPTQTLLRGATYTSAVWAEDAVGNAMTVPSRSSFRTALPAPTPGVCPCSLWDDAAAPAQATVQDAKAVELGVSFTANRDGEVRGVSFYKGPRNTGAHTGSVWSSTGQRLATAVFTNETASGWQSVTFATPLVVTAGMTYVASYFAPVGYYSATGDGLRTGFDNPPLSALPGKAVYRYGGGFPSFVSNANYWVDVVYWAPPVPPSVSSVSPTDGATNVPVASAITATFAEPVQPGSIILTATTATGAVPGSTTYDATRRAATFRPTAPLAAGVAHTVAVSATSLAGAPMPQSTTWTFRTSGVDACPCTLFPSDAVPLRVDSGDTSAITLGVKVVPTTDGHLTGVRFYKSAANTGTHTASVWSSTGTRMSTATFSGETASGWQTATLSPAVDVTAGATYVVSYFAPVGRYSVTSKFFDTAWNNGVVTSPAGLSGNGLYAYGADTFPTGSFGNSNYWVDAVFRPGPAPDVRPPAVTSSSPVSGASSVAPGSVITAQMSEAILAASLRMVVTNSSGAAVAGAVTYDATTRTATSTPSAALSRGTTYTVAVTATDIAGNTMTGPQTWQFSTAAPSPTPGVCPCSVWNDDAVPQVLAAQDGASVELGMTFTPEVNGTVTGVRFYKSTGNTGLHTGSLWDAGGVLLASAAFTAESTTGWQTVTFATPVSVVAGASYVVSYRAPRGRYSFTANGLSGVVVNSPLRTVATGGSYTYGAGFPNNRTSANFWVDVVLVRAANGT